ncbi:MAG: alpha/beta hydrolase-fold protein [Chloroflexota bacterium]|nr:alpha/beta hydrolase-fold protein [Chloroflexota bacterium]
MAHWQTYMLDKDPAQHSVVGNLLVTTGFYSPQLNNWRDIFVLLPPSYLRGDKRYPVLYMQDGQNLFDWASSYSGEWEVDETMVALERVLRLECIVVGVANGGMDRVHEYAPFIDPDYGGGRGDQYLDFLIDTLKPCIDSEFRTRSERAATGIVGSSMGGLISIYGYMSRPEIFGMCASMSGAYWFADKAILTYVGQTEPPPPGRVYLDSGTGEKYEPPGSTLRGLARCFCDDVQAVHAALITQGYQDETDVRYVQEIEGVHSETVWARRLPLALRFLMRDFIGG